MITTRAAGRTWHYSHSIGRRSAEHNTSKWGSTGGYVCPAAVAVAPDGMIFTVARGFGYEIVGYGADLGIKIGKTTIDEDHIGDFARGELTWPAGLAVASDGNIYCSDELENTVSCFAPDRIMTFPEFEPGGEHLACWGEPGFGDGQLAGPAGLAFDRKDNLHVADSRNDRVQKFTKDGEFLAGWGGSGDGEGQFRRPWGIDVDGDDNVYVADWGNDRVQKFSSDGTYLTSFGTDPQGGGDLDHPGDVAVDGDGDVYVTDWGNRRVQVFEADGEPITALYGHATEASKAAHYAMDRDAETTRKTNNRSENALPRVSRFDRPVAIVTYPEDRTIVADTQGRLVVYTKDRDYEEPNL